MIKTIAIALSMTALMAVSAYAGTVENSFGHTVVSRAPDGTETHWQYAPDGSFTMTTNGQTARGAWAYVDGQLCLTPEGGQQACYGDAGDHHVGDTWTLTTPDGQATTITIVE